MTSKQWQSDNNLERPIGTRGQRIEYIPLRNGLELMLGRHRFEHAQTLDFETSPDTLDLSIVLSGKVNNWVEGFTDEKQIRSPSTSLWMTPRLKGYCQYLPGEDIRYVGISINRLLLEEMTAGDLQEAPREFQQILQGKRDTTYHLTGAATQAMRSAATEVFDCPYHGGLKKLFVESKTLQLTTQLLAYSFGEYAANAQDRLPERDIRLVRRARDYLIESMEAPPTLGELANLLNTSESKLTRNFRKVYGTSIFAYLRDKRMETAGALLQSENISVTEVALSVGYTSMSHFTRAFTKSFGTNPQRYQQTYRRLL